MMRKEERQRDKIKRASMTSARPKVKNLILTMRKKTSDQVKSNFYLGT